MLVINARHLPVPLGRDHRYGPLALDPPHQGVAVVSLVRDHRTRFVALKQRLARRDIRFLTRCQEELDRVAQGVNGDGDLGRKPAPAPSQALIGLPAAAVPLLGAPAASWWARTTVESRMIHSKSGSCSASKTRRQTPCLDQRSNRRQTLFHLPKRSGRSRQG